MVYPTAPLYSFSSPTSCLSFSTTVQPSLQIKELEGDAIQSSAPGADTWEVFSAKAQLDLQLRQAQEQELVDPPDFPVGFPSQEAIDYDKEYEQQAVLGEVIEIVDHHQPAIDCDKKNEKQAVLGEVIEIVDHHQPAIDCDKKNEKQAVLGEVIEIVDHHQPAIDCDKKNEKQAVLEEVIGIFDYAFVKRDKASAREEILSQACNILLSPSLENRDNCIVLLCSVIQVHPNFDSWSPQEVLDILKKLSAIPTIHRGVCVTYLNQVIRTNLMEIKGEQVVEFLEAIYRIEQRIYQLSPTSEMPELFLRLFCPCISNVYIESICQLLEMFPQREVSKVMRYACILRSQSNWIDDTLQSLKMLYFIEPEDRDFSMPQLQRLNYQGYFNKIEFFQWFVKFRTTDQMECIDLMNSIMSQRNIHYSWNSDEIISVFAAIAAIGFSRALCVQHVEFLIRQSGIYWTAKQVIQFLNFLVCVPASDRINNLEVLNSLVRHPYISSWKVSELMNLFAQLGSMKLFREAYVHAFKTMIDRSGVRWIGSEVIRFLRCSLPVPDRIGSINFLCKIMPIPGIDQLWKIEEIMNVFDKITVISSPDHLEFERSERGWSAQEAINELSVFIQNEERF